MGGPVTAARRTQVTLATGPTDAVLFAAVARGELAALGQLFDRHAAATFQFIHKVAPREDVDDVVQETFLRLARLADRFEERGSGGRPFVFGVAHAIVRERRRASARLLRALAGFAGVESQRTVAPNATARTEVERCLATLSTDKREVLVLTEGMGLSGPEAAEVLGIPVGTVWTRLYHARRELRVKLGADADASALAEPKPRRSSSSSEGGGP